MCCCTKAFCGILDRVREVSLFFENSTLGMHLVPAAAAVRPGASSQGRNPDQEKNKKSYIAPAIISSIQDTAACQVYYRHPCMSFHQNLFYCSMECSPSPCRCAFCNMSCPSCQGLVSIGDAVSRVNGSTVSELNFNGLIGTLNHFFS